MNLMNQIFTINNDDDFNALALEVYRYQSRNIPIYSQYVQELNKPTPTHYSEIPFLPISFFKTHEVCREGIVPQVIFKSSGTTGQNRSQHLVEEVKIYEQSFFKAYELLVGKPEDQVILALLPSYVEQGESSLVYMVEHLVQATKNELSGFLLNSPEEIEQRYQAAIKSNKEVVIFGVSYALLDLAEININLSKAKIIETGGMKGRRKEMTKDELHATLKAGLNVPFISSEYGMTELLSQAYSNKDGLFEAPSWMKILIREMNDPFSYVDNGKTGGINVIDLANIHSCSFIATQDLGRIENNQFRIMGRFDNADLRGCNLLID